MYFAHSGTKDGGPPEPLREHLDLVAERAAAYASCFGADQEARVAGLLHDLGKYAEQFQRRLADPRHEPGRDHWSVGSLLAAMCYKHRGILPALAIEGHHAGLRELTEWKDLGDGIGRQFAAAPDAFTDTDVAELKRRFDSDGLALPKLTDGDVSSESNCLVPSGEFEAADMLDVRMLFSALVDADFIETEAHFAGNAAQPRRYRPEGPSLEPGRAFNVVRARIRDLAESSDAAECVQRVRNELADACQQAAKQAPGIFTLSAPTGSGKTLAMLAFALRHAMEHDLRRIILVMPFLNIIDQTSDEYRRLFNAQTGFADGYVIEDHSNVAEDKPDGKGSPEDHASEAAQLHRLLAENWDAPIVLTTSVQCLESLMSNRPSACRKLHRMARSVILFDEVQTLPRRLAVPTLATLSRLAARFGSSVVFATATQPAFEHLDRAVRRLTQEGWRSTPIAPHSRRLFAPTASRIHVQWELDEPKPWDILADELTRQNQQVLCIVNLRRHARRLARTLDDQKCPGLLHLSTDMCPAHRQAVLSKVRRRLETEEPLRLISTQCVEAGVDLDFPVVYRAFGPLEAIAQAAGRCNRHGRRRAPGVVRVFMPEPEDGRRLYPPGGYRQAALATRGFLRGLAANDHDLNGVEVLSDPDRLRSYFKQLYDLTGATEVERELREALTACSFERVAQLYRLIKKDAINVLVPYDEAAFIRLKEEFEQTDPLTPAFIRAWIRGARPHAISLFRPDPSSVIWNHLEPFQFSRRRERDNDEATWFHTLPAVKYDGLLGGIEGDDSFVI